MNGICIAIIVVLWIAFVRLVWRALQSVTEQGRREERVRVVAFLLSKGSDCGHTPEQLARAIDEGEHLRWTIR